MKQTFCFPPIAGEDLRLESVADRSAADIGLALLDAGPEFVIHAVVCQGQDNKGVVDDTCDDHMPRAIDLAPGPRDAAPAVSKVVVDAARHDCDTGTFRVFKQIHQGLLDQYLLSLPARDAEFGLAPPQNSVQLALRWPGEQDIA